MNIFGLAKSFFGGGARNVFGNILGGLEAGGRKGVGQILGNLGGNLGLDQFAGLKGIPSGMQLLAGGRGGGGGTGGYTADEIDPTLLAGGRKGGGGGGTHGRVTPKGQPEVMYA